MKEPASSLEALFSGRRTLGERVDATRAQAARDAAAANPPPPGQPDEPLLAPGSTRPPGPGVDGSVERAITEILDASGLAHYRRHREILIEYPCVAARVTRGQLLAEREALRAGWRQARVDLKNVLEPHAIDEVLELYAELAREWRERADHVAAVSRALPPRAG